MKAKVGAIVIVYGARFGPDEIAKRAFWALKYLDVGSNFCLERPMLCITSENESLWRQRLV